MENWYRSWYWYKGCVTEKSHRKLENTWLLENVVHGTEVKGNTRP